MQAVESPGAQRRDRRPLSSFSFPLKDNSVFLSLPIMVLVIGSPWKFVFSPFPQANRKQMITKLTKESGFLWLKSQNLFPISISSRTAKLEKTSFLINKQFLINVSERTMGTFSLEAKGNIWKQEMRPEGRKLKEGSGIWGSFESFMTIVIKSFLSQKNNVKRWVAVIFLNWKNFNVYPQKMTRGKKAEQYRDVTGTYSFNWASKRPKQIGAQWLGIHFCHRGAESLLQGSRVIVIHRETWVHRHTGTQWVRIWVQTEPHHQGQAAPVPRLLTCTSPVVHSKDKYHQHLHRHLLHYGKNNFHAETGRLSVCLWGWPVVLKAAVYQCDLAWSFQLEQTAASTETLIDPGINIYFWLFQWTRSSWRPLLEFGPQHRTSAHSKSHQEAGTLRALFVFLYFNFTQMDYLFLFISFLEGEM